MRLAERLREFFRQRYPLGSLADAAAHKTVPVHRHSFWYYWGGLTLFLIAIQIASGVLLLLYYRPSASEAFESVRFLMTKVEFGWLVRSVHAWAANLVIFCAFVHLASVFFLKAYRPPRELTWVTGALLLFLLMGFGFTGYLLPWNTLAFFATKVGTEIAGVVPVLGPIMQMFLRGGGDVGDVTLTRFFWLHIAILPIGLLGLLGLHLAMIQLQGMSKPLSVKDERAIPFFPNFLLRDLIGWVLMLGAVLAVSVYWPATLGQKADPFAVTPAGIAPEWYFLWMFQTLKLFPSHVLGLEGELVAVGLTGLAGGALVLVPWLDRPARAGRSFWLVRLIGVAGLLYIMGMTFYALWIGQHH
ncbi:MAG: cytochrome bc complex cytochrome b subunit [Candidatus Omnitrophica bacterium]|nr:cytochrome bc complex cytochrome b subunit [Candidatus Omnitrophota bacterium]